MATVGEAIIEFGGAGEQEHYLSGTREQSPNFAGYRGTDNIWAREHKKTFFYLQEEAN